MYLPAFWLHTISILEGISYQCNAFGEFTSVGMGPLSDCGFYQDEQLLKMWEEDEWKVLYRRAKRRRLAQRHMRQLRKKARSGYLLKPVPEFLDTHT
jgi:hypothetical protein